MHMHRLHVVVVAVCMIFLFSVVLFPVANADWAMFHADPSHSGAGTGNPEVIPMVWSYTTGGDVFSSPAVVDGVVYVGSGDGNVYALNASSGVKLWNYNIGSAFSSPAVVNGVVYIGSWDGNIYENLELQNWP